MPDSVRGCSLGGLAEIASRQTGRMPESTVPSPELLDARASDVGGMAVRRALPHRPRRTIGAWCLVDHYGPADVDGAPAMQLGPHPHIGLQTVTWLLSGDVVHHDSIGNEQLIRPGQLNLMTAGRGIAHAEISPADHGPVLHGLQLWIALPDTRRAGEPAFEHHHDLPRLGASGFEATVVVGSFGGVASPATTYTPIVGAQVRLHGGTAEIPLDPVYEHGVVVVDGVVELEGVDLEPGRLAYFGPGRSALDLTASAGARAFLVGGAPWTEGLSMHWNFVARTHEEIDQATADWNDATGRFGEVQAPLPVIPAPRPLWQSASS